MRIEIDVIRIKLDTDYVSYFKKSKDRWVTCTFRYISKFLCFMKIFVIYSPTHLLCKYLILIDKIFLENDEILYHWTVICRSFDVKKVFDHLYQLQRGEEPVVSESVLWQRKARS